MDGVKVILAANSREAIKFAQKHNLDAKDYLIVYGLRTLEGLHFRYEDVIRVPGWSQNPEIEDIEDRILRTHIALTGLQRIRSRENGTEWDIDVNLPMYTRDFLRMIDEGKIDDICTFGTVTH
jgi:hypothetical protein